MLAVLPLPSRLDNTAAAALREMLLNHRGTSFRLDASRVEKLGTLSVQVLLAARKTWDADGNSIALSDPSDVMVAKLAQIGLKPPCFATGAV